MNCLLFMAGGSGTRFGADIPKQYVLVNDEPLISYTLRKYADNDDVDYVVIASNPEWIEYTEKVASNILHNKLKKVVPGGYTRSHSVKNGLVYCKTFMNANDILLVHDATNPFVDNEAISRAIKKAEVDGIVCIGTRQLHTPYRRNGKKIESVIPRDEMCSGYSPEIFKFSIIDSFFEGVSDERLEKMTSTIALALDNGLNVSFEDADLTNIKITYKYDMETFKAIYEYERKIIKKSEVS